jgi:hypothetical protein
MLRIHPSEERLEVRRDFESAGLLEGFIKLAALLPADAPAVAHPQVHKGLLEKIWHDYRKAFEQRMPHMPANAVPPAPIKIRERRLFLKATDRIIDKADASVWSPGSPEQLYSLAYTVRSVLALIADSAAANFIGPLELPPPPALGRRELSLWRDGMSQLDPDPYGAFIEEISLHNLQRVRRCPKCSVVFWAHRRDARACSTSCASAIRVERSRKKAAEYKRYEREKAAKRRRFEAELRPARERRNPR